MIHVTRSGQLLVLFALTLLTGCADHYSAQQTSAVTGPTPTLEPAIPLIPLTLPSKPIPPPRAVPIVVATPYQFPNDYRAGEVSETSCFKVTAPIPGVHVGTGCDVSFDTLMIPSGPGFITQYFHVEAMCIPSPTLDGMEKQVLDAIAASNAKLANSGTPKQRYNVARDGTLGTSSGRYLGSRSGTIFGRPARILTWGTSDHGRKTQFVYILATLPRGRYIWDGKPVTALLISGYTAGYHPELFAYALEHLEMH